MAITPPSDLILDVAKAADPVSRQIATNRLRSIAASGTGEGFGLAFADASAGWEANFNRFSSAAATGSSGSGKSPAEKFEAMVLSQFVETMLPQDADAVFGEGATGEIWRSMLAEQVSNQIAASGGVGIADLISDSLKQGANA
ncbi:rod-binding protein [Roseibium aggregatum]|uniref:Rod-binding protein n=1 Tax=Roseibium aggregatum TaxID=187304 RepID=A0A939ECM2_9HYPH|nr:rod-binding protein [Roseibium aggregatum]MBN9670715.1 rod-binding protein [Roseibium aggregatum]